ncbi:MAG: response regulator [Muribaculaceae bacterium]|nr:response regulator [Muribaculaceae bacterium]MDE5844887.1 response regulator [Muribaculaceae bacterium]MDE7369803.1 response regulator [Muribaculaceae bacterium]
MSDKNDKSVETEQGDKKILVVDKDPFLAELVHYHFSKSGYTIESCLSIDDWFGMDPSDYSMIIVDVAIDSNCGTQIIESISQGAPGVSTLVCAPANDTNSIVLALNAGATDYITRPFAISDFVSRINTILQN